MRQVLALIPARGGSKGIPRKNVMSLAGKPVIAYSILQAQASQRINRIVVSTDDPETIQLAKQWGAEAPFVRPAEYAQDSSPDIDVFRHALSWLKEQEGYEPDLVVHLRPTGPVRRVGLIDQAVDLLAAHPEADAVRSVGTAHQTPYKMWRITSEGRLQPLLRIDGVADCQSLPRQQLPAVYWQNGYVDVIRPRAVLEKNSMWGDCAIPFIVEETLFELDYPEDIPAIEKALKRIDDGLPVERPKGDRHPV
ncbi:MAG TPA: acylneuraminate cytidylyltransferase family protein [Pyrinomonadaceae bacterium]|jgi:N-acylneuraminate cytidylyltransferase|nr:acylneuraminate cytidylyltransferase family protein [Pyrinomonadaceae bacterium]